MSTATLHPLYGRVFYLPMPWEQVRLEGNTIRCARVGSGIGRHGDKLRNPAEDDPGFWKEVKQLFFGFQRHDEPAIRMFYECYGRVGTFGLPQEREEHEECSETVEHRLDWFRELTVIVANIKDRKPGRLRELFDRAAARLQPPLSSGLEAESGRKPDPMPTLYLLGNELSLCIRFLPWLRLRKARGAWQNYWVGPESEDELYVAAWQAAADAIQGAFGHILTLPHPEVDTRGIVPLNAFVFYADGALCAAFLQWFFQEVATMSVTRCAARGCDRPVLPPRRKYCTERCRQREKKHNWREHQQEEEAPDA